jgi:hypothetical protein
MQINLMSSMPICALVDSNVGQTPACIWASTCGADFLWPRWNQHAGMNSASACAEMGPTEEEFERH